MNIIVCIKQVPETTEVRINPETGTLIREGVPSIINPFDMYAIEEGLRLRERFGGKVTVLTMGPPQAKEALRECISLGVDDAVLLSDLAFAGSDTLATSYSLSRAIMKLGGFDLIICGKQASDGDTAQVGPGIAECLNIPFVAFIKKIERIENGTVRVHRMMEYGYDVIELQLPALLTVVKEINEPRLPSLKGKIRARKYEPIALKACDMNVKKERLGLTGSPTQVIKVFTPEIRREGEMIAGDNPDEIARNLKSKLKEAGFAL
ncbi:MAG: electron transfer flavoprotein subunit beta/FixA family protein [Candidatus Sumerlaeota bacterium]|nr:electron transfer flavoprotein subunit beta/FixA family protein [Candidatus Sumerlaeota bacterium]